MFVRPSHASFSAQQYKERRRQNNRREQYGKRIPDLHPVLCRSYVDFGGISPKRLRRCFGFVLATAFSSRMASHMSQFVCEWFTSVRSCCYALCSRGVLFGLLLQARLPRIFL